MSERPTDGEILVSHMSLRFVEFKIVGGHNILINPANVCWLQQQDPNTKKVAVGTSDSESPTYVVGTLEEVVDKLMGKTSPPPKRQKRQEGRQ